MLHLNTKLIYNNKNFYTNIINLIIKKKIHLKNQSNKNQQILIHINKNTTKNNTILLPTKQLLLKTLFHKNNKIILTKKHNKILHKTFLQIQKFYLPHKKSSFYQSNTFLQ